MNRHLSATPPGRQRGISLIVAIVFLLLMTVIALSGLRNSTTNVQIVGNMQSRQEVVNTAQALVEDVVSSSEFATDPVAVKNSRTRSVDLNGDGTTDVTARVATTPVCVRGRPVPLADINPNNSADIACLATASAQNPGIVITPSAASQNTLCADTEWDVAVTATDAQSGASATIHQGMSIRTSVVALTNDCK